MGLNRPDDYHGISYKNVIFNKPFKARSRIIGNGKKVRDTSENGDPMGLDTEYWWIRKDEWFLSWDQTQNNVMLFDIGEDPFSKINLAEKRLDIKSGLMKELEVWKNQFLP